MTAPRTDAPVLTERQIVLFWAKVDKTPGQGPKGECWGWTACLGDDGYGLFTAGKRHLRAHKLALFLATGEWTPLCACHECDWKPCCRPDHIWPGTYAQNMQDASQKGRMSSGDTHYSRLHPELLPHGDDHWARRLPDKVKRGDNHYSRQKPEVLARGDRHGSKTHPEKVARGDRQGMRRHPEAVQRGELAANAVLTAEIVKEMRAVYAAGGITYPQVATRFGFGVPVVVAAITRRNWKHVD